MIRIYLMLALIGGGYYFVSQVWTVVVLVASQTFAWMFP